jgi:peroxiredoxin
LAGSAIDRLTIPKETRMSRLQIGDPAPDVTLPDHSGQRITLSEHWARRPVILLFLRHFG